MRTYNEIVDDIKTSTSEDVEGEPFLDTPLVNETPDQRTRVVLIGGGFGGMALLRNLDPKKFNVTLVDRNNFSSFPPLFYQVASSGLEPSSIAFPFRRELHKLRRKGWRFHLGDVKTINTRMKFVSTQYEKIDYDILIIAAGSTNNFFNMPELHKEVYTLKSMSQAMRCRNEVLDRLERASLARDPEYRRRLLSFTVIGGGPAGVEVAGALGEMKRYIVPREYPMINQDEVRITLVEGTNRLLGAMDDKLGEKAEKYLRQLMVDVQLGKTMTKYEDNVVTFSDTSKLYSETLIWTAGITAVGFRFEGPETSFKTGPGNRLVVDEFNQVEGLEGVYAIGDVCIHMDDRYPKGCPQLAQVAIQQGKTLAKNLNKGELKKEFKYFDKGTMATVGRNRAVVEMKHFNFGGFIAWFTWMFIHLVSLMGMRNRLTVMINWIWAYFTYSSSLRLLFRIDRYPLRSYIRDSEIETSPYEDPYKPNAKQKEPKTDYAHNPLMNERDSGTYKGFEASNRPLGNR